jgi:hypothetical protein
MATYAYTFTSGDTVTPTKLNNARTVSDIVNADIKSDAAIAGTKIAPDFGSQNVVTTGKIVRGSSSAFTSASALTAGIQAQSSGVSDSSLGLYSFNTTANQAGRIDMGRTRGAVGAFDVVQSGDQLGVIRFTGGDGTAMLSASELRCEVDGTPGTNDMPGRLVFSTTADGGSSPTERLRITAGGLIIADSATSNTTVAGSFVTSGRIQSDGSYSNTTGSAANVHILSTGLLARSTSSQRYKTDIEAAEQSYSEAAVLTSRPVWFRSTCAEDRHDWSHWGFIAEEIAEIDPRLVQWGPDENGNLRPEGVQYDRFVPHLCAMIQKQQAQIAELSAKVTALESA